MSQKWLDIQRAERIARENAKRVADQAAAQKRAAEARVRQGRG